MRLEALGYSGLSHWAMLTPAAVRTGARAAGAGLVAGVAEGAANGEGTAGDGVGLTAAMALGAAHWWFGGLSGGSGNNNDSG